MSLMLSRAASQLALYLDVQVPRTLTDLRRLTQRNDHAVSRASLKKAVAQGIAQRVPGGFVQGPSYREWHEGLGGTKATQLGVFHIAMTQAIREMFANLEA